MTHLKDLIESKKPGEVFAASPQILALTEAQFDAAARGWVRAGGGDGFSIVKAHRESMTAESRYDHLLLKKTG